MIEISSQLKAWKLPVELNDVNVAAQEDSEVFELSPRKRPSPSVILSALID
jgi:hypothetical protein